jgi:hypothetical protein
MREIRALERRTGREMSHILSETPSGRSMAFFAPLLGLGGHGFGAHPQQPKDYYSSLIPSFLGDRERVDGDASMVVVEVPTYPRNIISRVSSFWRCGLCGFFRFSLSI